MHIDLYRPAIDGYRTNFVRSTVIEGRPTSGQEALLEACVENVRTIIAAVRPGVTLATSVQSGTAYAV